MSFLTVALFEGAPHFFENSERKPLLSPAFNLRAGRPRSENGHFWSAMEDVFLDAEEPASGIIERRNILDGEQQAEIRYCAALIGLRRGDPFGHVVSRHGIDGGIIRDILQREDESLRDLRAESRVFRDALGGVYMGESVLTVMAVSHIVEPSQQAVLEDHGFMFYIRRGMPPRDVIETHGIKDERMARRLFRESVRLEIEKGNAAPKAILDKGMTNEQDKALMRLISASEDIGEGMPISEAAARNEVPDERLGELEAFREALNTTASTGGPLKRKREVDDIGSQPDLKRRLIRPASGRKALDAVKTNPAAALDLTDSPGSMIGKTAVCYVLNDRDELVPEEDFPLRNRADGTKTNPIDLTETAPRDTSRRGLTERRRDDRSSVGGLD